MTAPDRKSDALLALSVAVEAMRETIRRGEWFECHALLERNGFGFKVAIEITPMALNPDQQVIPDTLGENGAITNQQVK